MSNFIKAMIITIIGFVTLLIQVIIMTPMFFEFADAVNKTATGLFSGSILTSWNSNYALGVNIYWGLVFIILLGVVIYLYVWAQRKEYQVMFR